MERAPLVTSETRELTDKELCRMTSDMSDAVSLKLLQVSIAILLTLTLTGCASYFTKVDFKYSNLAHMNYRDAMTEVTAQPEELIFDLSEAFRRNGANILERTQLNTVLTENADGRQCWEADYEIFQQEFAAYRVNNFSMYQSIDRVTPYASRLTSGKCSVFSMTPVADVDSWFLRVELPPRTAQATLYQPTTDSFFMFGQNKTVQGFSTSYIPEQVNMSISTRLYVYAWKQNGSQNTKVYLFAKPVSGQIEANLGNWIGHTWWQMANGYSEMQVVKSYLMLIQEYDRKKAKKVEGG